MSKAAAIHIHTHSSARQLHWPCSHIHTSVVHHSPLSRFLFFALTHTHMLSPVCFHYSFNVSSAAQGGWIYIHVIVSVSVGGCFDVCAYAVLCASCVCV